MALLHRSRHLAAFGSRHIPATSSPVYFAGLLFADPTAINAVLAAREFHTTSNILVDAHYRSIYTGFVGRRDEDSDSTNKRTSTSTVIHQDSLHYAAPLHTRTFASLPHLAEASRSQTASSARPDPFSLVREEIDGVTERLRRSVMTDIPVLERAAEYFFRAGQEGKRLRSSIILLMSTALASEPTSPLFLIADDSPASDHPPEQRRRQQRIAEITELIHVASLLHDDVIDNADSRRGLKALNSLLGNKVAILAGDFLLARASVTLASLRNSEVIALMSQVLEHLVAGEILQMTTAPDDALSMEYYLRKSYFKTASLMANSCKSVAVLAQCSPDEATAAWDYGRHLGLAFQLIDDVLDFTATSEELGKPVGSDLRAGLATAPVLFAAIEHPELVPLIKRRFGHDGDVDMGLELVKKSSGVEQATALAAGHARDAAAALERLPPAEGDAALASRAALEDITRRVLVRRK